MHIYTVHNWIDEANLCFQLDAGPLCQERESGVHLSDC